MTSSPDALTLDVLGLKGGIGKTTIALGLTSAARRRGMRVLYVDLDPQCNGTSVVSHPDYLKAVQETVDKPREAPMALIDLLEMEEPTLKAVQETLYPANDKWSGVYVLPATENLEKIERSDPGVMNTFSEIMRLARPLVDLVVMDSRPAMNMLTTMGARESEVIFAVAEPVRFGVQGLATTWRKLGTLRRGNGLPRLRKAAAVVTQFDANKIEHRGRVAEMRAGFNAVMLDEALPLRECVSQAISAGVPIHDYDHPKTVEVTPVLDKWLDQALEAAA